MKLLVFDNYDSFTYNIVHALRQLGVNPDVRRNDAITLDEIDAYDKIIISPGPGIPEEAGLLMPMLERYASVKPILGVCLGHQAIGQHFGARLHNLTDVFHGVATPVVVTDTTDYLFDGLPTEIEVGRYHSWVVDRENFPSDQLEITAVDESGMIMAMRHRWLDIHGVQFHPESVLTPQGMKIIENWLRH
ncbi:MAG: aminodeoxychorismate/anthranilate synthase component II [Muribaculaceae bacterium]|nr:aminodeoxychorismate/anthranilate synthase component II [Muribaculaceae bacterium]